MSESFEKLVGEISASGIVPQDELVTLADSVAGVPQDLTCALVDGGKMTQFQADTFLKGESKNLVLGQYVVLDQIGRGGMGVVYRARHVTMDREVALKLLPPEAMRSQALIDRFYREIRAAAKLNHPNIVTAFDAGEHEGSHFLVMEIVNGADLGVELRDRGSGLAINDAVDCVLQAARGLAFAHERGIIHRDIKPGNMLRDNDGVVKMLDMGLARLTETEDSAAEETLTITGRLLGTVEYMSPEQSRDPRAADGRSDIYSLGCVLYRLVTGSIPYTGSSVVDMALAHSEQPIPTLSEFSDEVPGELESIYFAMMAKKPGERIQTMNELVTALDSLFERGVLEKPQRAKESSSPSEASIVPVAHSRRPKTSLDGLAVAIKERKSETPTMDSDYPAPSRVEPIAVERKAVVWIAGGVAASLITIVVMLIALPKGDPPPDIKPPPVVVAPDNPTPPVTPPAPTPTPVEIKPNSAMYFDGDDDYVVIPSLVFDGKPPLTIEAIVSVHDAKRDAAIVALGGTGFAKLKHNERGFRGYGSTSLAGKGRAYHVAAHGGAVHVAFVWTGDDARMYVDGRDVQPYANEITFKSRGATNARIGVHKFEDHIEYFKGVIDEVRISNTARYDTDSPAPTVRVGHRFETDEHTVALYHFDGEDAEKLIDSSGNDHHGTIVGAKRIDFIGKSSPDSVSD